MRKLFCSFFVGLLIVSLPFLNTHAAVRIVSISPSFGPPGSVLMIRGADLLPAGEKKIIFFFNAPGHIAGKTIPIFMDLREMSWSRSSIQVRLPGLNEAVFRMSLTDMPGRLSDTIIDYLNSNEVTGLVGIYEKRSGTWHNYSSGSYFRLTSSPDNPVIHMLSRTSAHVGDGLAIYGSSFGPDRGEVVFSRGDTEISSAPSLWSPTFITLTIPSTEGGYYEVKVRRGGVLSNSQMISISSIIGTPETPEFSPAEEAEGPDIDMDIEEGVGLPPETGTPEPSIAEPLFPVGGDVAIPMLIHPACEAIYPVIPPPSETPSSCTFFFWTSRGQIDSIDPSGGPPGTFVEINGKCFGEEQGTRKITISGADFTEPRDLEVFSWSDKRIVARIPGPELIYPSPTGGEELARYSDGAIQYIYSLTDSPIYSMIRISDADWGRDNPQSPSRPR